MQRGFEVLLRASARPRAVAGAKLATFCARARKVTGALCGKPRLRGRSCRETLRFCCAQAPALGRTQARSFPTTPARAQEGGRCPMQRAPCAGPLHATGLKVPRRASARPRAVAGAEVPHHSCARAGRWQAPYAARTLRRAASCNGTSGSAARQGRCRCGAPHCLRAQGEMASVVCDAPPLAESLVQSELDSAA